MTALSLGLAAVWIAAFWVMSRESSDTLAIALVAGVASMIGVGFAAAPLWPRVLAGYPSDSFWTLGWAGRAGVVAISGVGIAALFAVLTVKTRVILRVKQQATNTAWVLIDLALGLALFAVIYSVSPQVFYAFYRLIIPGLPQQWVIDGAFDVTRLAAIARIGAEGSLSDDLAGVTLWAIVPLTLWLHLRDWWRGGR